MPAVFGEGARGGIRVAEQLTAIKRSIQPIRHDFDSEFVFGNGARRGIRTPDRLIKRLLLAPGRRPAESLGLYSDSSPGAALGSLATGP